MVKNEIYYRAMLARDPRFDGKFFVAVKTTGIYCRPICPAKPKRKNVEFFSNSISAENAGYRPCLRCRPESAPQSPAWIGTSAVVRRAVRMLHSPEAVEYNENKFSDLFGVTARHLRRLFKAEVGKTPKQLAFENRLNLSRKLITETPLAMTEIAFASGFRSIRRFNASFKQRFKRSPGKIRRERNLDPEMQVLRVSLVYRPPFDFKGLMHFYQAHQVGSLEWFENDKMHRIVASEGRVGQITIENDPQNSRLLVEMDFPETGMIPDALARVRAMFDLDSDPVMIANSLETDPKIKKILKKHAGIRLPSGWDPFEVSVSAILGQVVSVERGKALVSDLIEMAGTDSGLKKNGRTVKLFPTPEQVLQADLKKLKSTGARKQTLIDFSKAILEKKISLNPAQEIDSFLEKIKTIRGIGPWTAAYIAMKALRHTDAFPGTDLILARALTYHPRKIVDAMSPWRGYAAALFWREYSQTLKKQRRKK